MLVPPPFYCLSHTHTQGELSMLVLPLERGSWQASLLARSTGSSTEGAQALDSVQLAPAKTTPTTSARNSSARQKQQQQQCSREQSRSRESMRWPQDSLMGGHKSSSPNAAGRPLSSGRLDGLLSMLSVLSVISVR